MDSFSSSIVKNSPSVVGYTANFSAFSKNQLDNLENWKNMIDLIPENYKQSTQKKKSGLAGIFAACLELSREGIINIMQKKTFDDILIKKNK